MQPWCESVAAVCLHVAARQVSGQEAGLGSHLWDAEPSFTLLP